MLRVKPEASINSTFPEMAQTGQISRKTVVKNSHRIPIVAVIPLQLSMVGAKPQ